MMKIADLHFPIILDSPFLQVPTYKANLLKVLAETGRQIIILALDLEVAQMTNLGQSAGKQYTLKIDSKTRTGAFYVKIVQT